ncbi:MAG TPA: hypothetical protein G4O10_05345 [Dehalococcoidia bacterium]|nr:hypothetical protein [Dehalococcoidia bacterium]
MDDSTADVVATLCIAPLGEDIVLTPTAPEWPLGFAWSRSVYSSDMIDDFLQWNLRINFVGADDAEITYNIVLTYSYHIEATGSREESANAYLAHFVRTHDASPSSYFEVVYHLDIYCDSDTDIFTTSEKRETITEEYDLTFSDGMSLEIGAVMIAYAEENASSEVTYILEEIRVIPAN